MINSGTDSHNKNIPLYAGIFIVSLSILGFELILNRMLGLRFWYHFTFMIISIALFGIGVGGLLVFFINKFVKKHTEITLSIVTLLLALFIPISLIIINNNPMEIDKIAKSVIQQEYFINFFLFLSIPFVLAGFIFSFIFTNYKEDISRIYFFDLAGGGIGCLFILLIFPHNGPFISVFIIALLTLIASGLFLFNKARLLSSIIGLMLIITGIIFFYPKIKNTQVRISPAKEFTYKLGEKIFYDWNNFGYAAVHRLSPRCFEATANYSSYADMYASSNQAQMDAFRGYPTFQDHYYPFVIKKQAEKVGIVGVGAGKDILISLNSGAKNIYGAEFNPTMYDILMKKFTGFTGNIGHRSNVHIYNKEGRFFIRSSKIKYDVLIFDNAIAIAAVQSGAFTLAEGYLFTVEAIEDYINHLEKDGVLYLSNPYSDCPRFITIIREAFNRLNRQADFKDCIFAADNQSKVYKRCKILVKKSKFTRDEVNKLISYSESIKQKVVYAPYNKLQTYEESLVTAKNIEELYEKDNSEIRPSIDDWPFYSQRVKLEKRSLKWAEKNPTYYHSEPFLMLKKMTMVVIKYSLLFLILPLLLLNLKGFKALPNKFGSVIYFASLGLGFMFMEIVLMQKYMLILGHPVYSFSVVLASLLISSGIGSFFSDRIKNPFKAMKIGIVGIIVSTIIAFLFIKYIGNSIIVLPFVFRVVIITLITSMSGIFMGIMMPCGIRAVSKVESSIPWLWSINSIFSVVAGFLAIYLSILYGFTIVLIMSLVSYLIGSVFFIFRKETV